MKNSREPWAQLVACLEVQVGGPGTPEAEATRFGEANPLIGWLSKDNKISLP